MRVRVRAAGLEGNFYPEWDGAEQDGVAASKTQRS